MTTQASYDRLINDIISDNPTYPFPIQDYEFELTALFLDRSKMRFYLKELLRKLEKEYSYVFVKIFLNLFLQEFDLETLSELSNEDYYQKIENLISRLYKIKITVVSKNSSDYEFMKEL